jgi:hypothetical protein
MEGLDSKGQGPTSGCCAIEEEDEETGTERPLRNYAKFLMLWSSYGRAHKTPSVEPP